MSVHNINLEKMRVLAGEPVQYYLQDSKGDTIDINSLIGRHLSLEFTGEIICAACKRLSKKSFNQGYCYPCFKSLARCDMCIMKPETCHYHEGTCREPEWADKHCMQAHYVYLSNASGLKVGITRQDQLPTRWIDQGAIQATPLYRVSNRYQAGLVESCLATELKDKTNWRVMLKGETDKLDLLDIKKDIHARFVKDIEKISEKFGKHSLEYLEEGLTELNYPVDVYPEKIKSYNFDKTAAFSDVLNGIKGQYLIFSDGVINIRKFGAYQIVLSIHE